MQSKQRIGILVDPRLSRERGALLTRTINTLRQIAEVQLLSGDATEEETLKKLEETPFQLVFAPWYRYLHWSRVDSFFGRFRTSGPTFVGYHCDQLNAVDIGPQADHLLRTILFDFGTLSNTEVLLLCRALLHDTRRSGIQPLLKATTSIYCENWYAEQGLGSRIDSVFSIPTVSELWNHRATSLRILLIALWSLIYEEGPGKGDFGKTQSMPRAAFQIAADEQILVLRLSYAMPGWTAKSSVNAFWPTSGHPSTPYQLLLRYADLVRLHTISDSPMVELVVGLLRSAPAEKHHGALHTLWVEPISNQLVTEPPYDLPSPNTPRLQLLPVAPSAVQKPRLESEDLRAKDRYVAKAATDIRLLRAALAQREELIKELRMGGVSTAPPLPPPDTEALLEAFQQRYFEARFQIRHFEIQIAELEKRNAAPGEIETLRQRMEALASREKAWIKSLIKTIQAYRDSRKTPS